MTYFNEAAGILAIAALLDYLIGDPWNWLHPVQVMGWGIQHYTQAVFRWVKQPVLLRLLGVVLGLGLPLLSTGIGWALIQIAGWINQWVAIALQVVLLSSCFAGRSLRAAADSVLHPLSTGDLAAARAQLSLYVGRDTADLSAAEILRAVLETVTENAVDGVMAPLFYAILGAFTPVGSVPVALAYKAASTLDSMVGYREPPYTQLGWFSARQEDGLTWLPCRLTVLTLALLSGHPRRVWTLCDRDANKDPSPNAGWSECAYAAILQVQMGGTNTYRGIVKHKPLLGDPINTITSQRIALAMRFTRFCCLIWLSLAIVLLHWQVVGRST
jgi:adenosylcobinamide-phosphate synthase